MGLAVSTSSLVAASSIRPDLVQAEDDTLRTALPRKGDVFTHDCPLARGVEKVAGSGRDHDVHRALNKDRTARTKPILGVRPPVLKALHSSRRSAPAAAASRADSREPRKSQQRPSSMLLQHRLLHRDGGRIMGELLTPDLMVPRTCSGRRTGSDAPQSAQSDPRRCQRWCPEDSYPGCHSWQC